MPDHNLEIHGHVGDCAQLVKHSGTRVDLPCPTTAQGKEQRMNDTNTDGDGPTWIQTATGRDKLRTAGGTPTQDSHTHPESNRSAKHKGASK